MDKKKGNIKVLKTIGKLSIFILKPFMPLIIFFTILIVLIGYFVDIFDWKIKNEEEKVIKSELAYYEKEDSFEDIKEFVSSAWDFISGEKDLKWPVKGHNTITSKFGYRDAPTARSIYISWAALILQLQKVQNLLHQLKALCLKQVGVELEDIQS